MLPQQSRMAKAVPQCIAWLCRRVGAVLVPLALFAVLHAQDATADVVEFLSGAKSRGKVVSKDDKYLTFNTTIGTKTFARKYPLERIHAVIVGDRRYVLNEKTADGPAPPRRPGSTRTRPGTGGRASAGDKRSRTAVNALIDRQGRTAPEWFDSVPLNYPKSLDLSWPQPAPKPWNNQRNVGQYVWEIINPNPSKWREGVRFMHHMLQVNQNNPAARQRVMNELGRMYYGLLQDYPRAAFWWRKAEVDQGRRFLGSGVRLAEVYWKLGNKQMAMDLLRKLPPQFSMIKLLGDMGETQLALRMADHNSRGDFADFAYLYAGDACRVAGQYAKALQYYQKLATMRPSGKRAKGIQRNQNLGRANMEAVRLFEMLDLRRVPDGTYQNSSLGFETQLHVEVVVHGSRIESVRVTQHKEKQYYAAMIDTPRKIVEKQGFKGIDAFSGATITSQAIINATAKALAAAMK